eukprot:COSAG03_NODE_17246_length_380_cov_0.921708_1_plen_22_part_01
MEAFRLSYQQVCLCLSLTLSVS